MIILKLLALGLLLASGLALDCDWDASVDPDQGLVLDYQARGARKLGGVLEGSDPDSCRAACCADPACDLAVVGFPADGPSLCQLVDCGDDQDACALRPTDQFKVYRKNVMKKADREAQGGGQEEHIVPLMDRWEPRTNESDNLRCRLPMKVGSCRAAFPRFFYNVTNQSCSSFIYGGCEANGNNFESQEDCEATCAGVTGSVLPDESTPAPPPVKAPRMAPASPAETDPESAESIPLQKSVSVLPSSKKHDDDKDFSDDKDSCTAKPDPGPCRAAFPMFYYDPYSASCQSFMYGGCHGNENRYSTEDECMRHCSEGWFDTHGKTRNRWTAAFFLFVTLAAISALLLATLVVITLRRHRLFRRLSSNSDKEELLPDQDEQSSLDSLPLPESPKPDQKA